MYKSTKGNLSHGIEYFILSIVVMTIRHKIGTGYTDTHYPLSLSAVEIQKYLEYINTLKYQQEPDYEFIRKLLKDGLKKRGGTDDGKNVKFTTGKVSSPSSSAVAAELCNGHSSPEKETRDKAARQRPAAKVGRARRNLNSSLPRDK